MSAVDECCAVCAEPLEWTAVGPCGHRETCSRCVSRLRHVMKDRRCVICQQDVQQLYFTRFMGDYTARVAPELFAGLQARADKGELFACPEVDGFFDDREHYAVIKSLCSITHALVIQGALNGKPAPTFPTFGSLRKHIESVYKQHFCDICLVGRKVFASEQQAYTKADLDKHNKQGDDTGPLAESGFKGHPSCRFCHTRFYDSNELFKHMETAHEHCFICRRARPDKYVYYRHYKELEDHFGKDHHLCPHPTCLVQHFIVFTNETDLKRHFAMEHGDEMKLSRAQRREAMSIPVNFQLRGRGEEEGYHSEGLEAQQQQQQMHDRPGTIIGGGFNVRPRTAARPGRGGGASGSMSHSRSDPHMQAALHASIDTVTEQVTRQSAAAHAAAAPPSHGPGPQYPPGTGPPPSASAPGPQYPPGTGPQYPPGTGPQYPPGTVPSPAQQQQQQQQSQQQQQQQQQGSSYSSSASRAEQQQAADSVSSVTFNVEDFPIASGRGPSATGPMGRWAAFAAGGASSGRMDGSSFPSLPSLSKAAKKRLKEQGTKTLAERLAASGGPGRVIHRAEPTSAYANDPSGQPVMGGDAVRPAFPALPSSSTGSAAAAAAASAGNLNSFGGRGTLGSLRGTAGGSSNSLAAASAQHSHSSNSLEGFTQVNGGSMGGGKGGMHGSSSSGNVAKAAEAVGQASSYAVLDYSQIGAGDRASDSPSHSARPASTFDASTVDWYGSQPLSGRGGAAASNGSSSSRSTAMNQAVPAGAEDYPTLGGSASAAAGGGADTSAGPKNSQQSRAAPTFGATPGLSELQTAYARSLFLGGSGSSSSATPAPFFASHTSSERPATAPGPQDFPSLGGGPSQLASSSGNGGGGNGSSSSLPPRTPTRTKAHEAASRTGGSSPAQVSAAQQQQQQQQQAKGGMSESMKAAAKALVEKIRGRLGSGGYADFKSESGQFGQGLISADAYHDRMVSLGLLSVVAELAALHPVPERQALLMAAHRAYLASPAAQEPSAGRGKKAGGSSSRSSSSSSGWVPPPRQPSLPQQQRSCTQAGAAGGMAGGV
ncbi:MAG: hypothetical protein WDW36_002493 [Sanguina aurantia]